MLRSGLETPDHRSSREVRIPREYLTDGALGHQSIELQLHEELQFPGVVLQQAEVQCLLLQKEHVHPVRAPLDHPIKNPLVHRVPIFPS